MRRLVVFCTLLALAAPLAAAPAFRAPGDGTLSVRDLNGYIAIRARGGVIGRCDQCVFRLDAWRGEEITPVVSGARGRDVDGDGDKELFTGRDARWRVIGGSFELVVRNGVDVDLSVVGRGRVRIQGRGGTYVLNGGDTIRVSETPTILELRAGAVSP